MLRSPKGRMWEIDVDYIYDIYEHMIFSMLVYLDYRKKFNFNGNFYNYYDWLRTYEISYNIALQFYRLLGIALRLKSKARTCKHPCKKQLKHFCCFPFFVIFVPLLLLSFAQRKKESSINFLLAAHCLLCVCCWWTSF